MTRVQKCTECRARATSFGVFKGFKTYKEIVSRCDAHYTGQNNSNLTTFSTYAEAKAYVDTLNVKRKL